MNAADMPMWNDLSAIKAHHDDLKAQIASLQAQLKIVKNTLEDMFPSHDPGCQGCWLKPPDPIRHAYESPR